MWLVALTRSVVRVLNTTLIYITSLKKYFFNQLEDVNAFENLTCTPPSDIPHRDKKISSRYKKYVQILQLSKDFENKLYQICIVKLSEINVL